MHICNKLVALTSVFWSMIRTRANIVQVPPDQGWFEASLFDYKYFVLVVFFHKQRLILKMARFRYARNISAGAYAGICFW